MNAIYFKRSFLCLLTLLLSFGLCAQQYYFIYIQAENKQPFFVKMDKKIFSSSASGYIILSRLTDSDHKLVIGFPHNQWPDMAVTIKLQDTNAGFLLKKYGKDDWGLVNLQNNQLQLMQVNALSNMEPEQKIKGDEFAQILAAVVNDSSIAEASVVKPAVAAKKVDVNKTQENRDTTTEAKTMQATPPPGQIVPLVKTEIRKLTESSNTGGLYITYLDKENSKGDTISIFIPIKVDSAFLKNITAPVKKDTLTKPVIANIDSRFINMDLPNPNSKTDSAALKADFIITEKKSVVKNDAGQMPETIVTPTNTGTGMINSDCKKNASQNDFLKLRKQMAAQSSEKNMLIAAYKQFISTCFTTEQVKNLGVLFITEEERYKFFVAAFPFVSDTHNFGAMEDQLTDDYYKTRFKAMLSR